MNDVLQPEIAINLHPVNFLILSGVVQSMVLAGVLLFRRKGNRQAGRYMGFLLFLCSLHFSWTLIIDTNLDFFFRPIAWFPYSGLLAIGPLVFFYTRSLTTSGLRISRQELIHFLPFGAEIAIQLFFIQESVRRNILPYEAAGFLIFRVIEFAGAAASIFIYGRRCLHLIQGHEAWLVEQFSNSKDVTLSWLRSLVRYLRVLWICWLTFEVAFLLFWQFQIHLLFVYALLYLLLGVVAYSTYWIGLQALIKMDRLEESKIPTPQPADTGVYNKLEEAEINGCVDMLERLMTHEKLYLHEDLTLRILADRLQKDPNLVSHVLNQRLNQSFYDYVNAYRVHAVKDKIADPANAHLKIVEIAYACGFNSKATFNRVFKNITGQSPSEYKKNAFPAAI